MHEKLLSKFLESAINIIFFTDEKAFTVAPSVSLQNNYIYMPSGTKKCAIAAECLLCTWPTFSKSVMVSVAVLKLVCTELILVKPGVKVDGA